MRRKKGKENWSRLSLALFNNTRRLCNVRLVVSLKKLSRGTNDQSETMRGKKKRT